MAFDGAGVFNRLFKWTQDAANNINITASRVDSEDDGFAAGLSNCVTRDGQGKMTADFLPNADNTLNLGSALLRWTSLNGVSVANLPVTQQNIGLLLYPRVAAEVTAGITPTFYNYPVGNVLRYGADPTGVLDSATAIQAAITITQINGGIVYLPQGQYKISSTLAVADVSTGVYIQGAGVGATTILPSAAVTVALKFGVTGTINQGFSNLTIDCKNATSCTAVLVNNIEYFYADNFLINQANIGISVAAGVVHFYTRWNINRSISYGVLVVGGGDQYFDNGVMSSVGFVQAVVGINIQSSGGVWLSNLDIISQGTGILLDPGNGQVVDWLFANNVAVDTNSSSGITIQPSGTGVVNGCDFTACWSASASAFGVFTGGTGTINGLRFNGLRCQNNQQHGVIIAANATNVQFVNCDISGNSAPVAPWSGATQYSPGNLVTQSGTTYQCVLASLNNSPPNATYWSVFGAATYQGVLVNANASAFSLLNNRIGAESGYGVIQAYGIFINAGTSNNYQVIGNDLRGNATGGLLDAGAGPNKMVKDNLGYNPISQTAITVGASPFTYTNNTGAPIVVYVQAGTVSQVLVNGLVVGTASNGSYAVPQGIAIQVTYSVAPTMVYLGT